MSKRRFFSDQQKWEMIQAYDAGTLSDDELRGKYSLNRYDLTRFKKLLSAKQFEPRGSNHVNKSHLVPQVRQSPDFKDELIRELQMAVVDLQLENRRLRASGAMVQRRSTENFIPKS